MEDRFVSWWSCGPVCLAAFLWLYLYHEAHHLLTYLHVTIHVDSHVFQHSCLFRLEENIRTHRHQG